MENGEYLYLVLDRGLTIKYKTYIVKPEEDDFESQKELIIKNFCTEVEEKNKKAIF